METDKKVYSNIYWLYLPNNTRFETRKEAKLMLGTNRFHRLIKEGKLVFCGEE